VSKLGKSVFLGKLYFCYFEECKIKITEYQEHKIVQIFILPLLLMSNKMKDIQVFLTQILGPILKLGFWNLRNSLCSHHKGSNTLLKSSSAREGLQ
jgi:hypothetical protein